MEKIGVVATIYIDNDETYRQAKRALDSMKSKYKLVFYARVTKLNKRYTRILKRFDKVNKNRKNILARSWNKGIEKALRQGCKYVIVPNLDIALTKDTIDNLVGFAKKDDSVMWSGRCSNTGANYPQGDFVVNSFDVYDNFSFFMVGPRLFKEVGKFDERFEPAYGEDVDMQYRIDLAGKKHTCVSSAPFKHFGQTTLKHCKGVTQEKAKRDTDRYFIKKWGGPPRGQVYLTPFNK
jgi:GT2 family glycosyltransferase